MGTRDPRVDAYIEKAQPFARPILQHLRKVVHAGCPGVEETMKWSAPHFMYQGMLCGMQAFKEHCAFGFWKGSLIEGLGARGEDAMGHFGRITSIQDLPPQKTLIGLVTQAAALNEQGVKVERTARRKKAVEPPEDLVSALRKNKKALAAFQAFSPSHRREYVEWIGEAKRDDTRQRRLATAIEWLSEGKPRNWKYGRTAE
jgi:uncharacterized protein YdeI (YjbR/CyaY-like superfamily)